ERAVQRGGAVGEGHCVPRARVRSEGPLELVDARPARQPVAAERGDDGGDVVVVDRLPAVGDHDPSIRRIGSRFERVTSITVSGRAIGPGEPCYVIAEAGSNHNRDLDTARKLIDVAADAGADAVKFQTYSGTTLYSTKTPRFDYLDDELAAKPAHELLDEIALPRDWQPILAELCRERGVEFMSSPFDRAAVDELDALDVGAFKIASFELVDLPFIRYAAACGRPLILSTGMASLGEIEDAITAAHEAGCDEIALLQCA